MKKSAYIIVSLTILFSPTYTMADNSIDNLTSSLLGEFSSAEEQNKFFGQLPQKGSEDASGILGNVDSVLVEEGSADSDNAIQANPKIDWSLKVTFNDGKSVTSSQLAKALLKTFPQLDSKPIVYINGEGLLMTARKSTQIKQVQFVWPYLSTPLPNKTTYKKRIKIIEKGLRSLAKYKVEPSLKPVIAASKSKEFNTMLKDLNQYAVIILKAPKDSQFDGKAIWDVMYSLGLEWGNLDLFHWLNKTNVGDQSLFQVWTSTEPGFFLTEEILNNKLQVDDLYFGFPIARSHSPIKIFDAMLTAANYTQKRLGGTILDMQRQEFDFKRNQTFIQNIVNDLATKDLKPGSEETLNIFQDETAAYWKARALKFQDTRLTELSTNTTNT